MGGSTMELRGQTQRQVSHEQEGLYGRGSVHSNWLFCLETIEPFCKQTRDNMEMRMLHL